MSGRPAPGASRALMSWPLTGRPVTRCSRPSRLSETSSAGCSRSAWACGPNPTPTLVCPTASDRHFFRVLWCPVGKGDPKWQAATSGLFLGIDHTAIVVGDTAASLRYYKDVLGLQVVGERENFGPEQAEQRARRSAPDHHAARRRGPGSRAARVWHREPAAPRPSISRPMTSAYWQIHFVVSDAEAASSAARAALGGADQSRGRGPDGWQARLPPRRPCM